MDDYLSHYLSQREFRAAGPGPSFSVPLLDAADHVASLEVAELSLDPSVFGPFSSRAWLDVEIVMTDTLGFPLPPPAPPAHDVAFVFSAKLPPLDAEASAAEMALAVEGALNNALTREFTDGAWIRVTARLDDVGRLSLVFTVTDVSIANPAATENTTAARTLGFNSGWIVLQSSLLFASGPHPSPAAILGFDAGADLAATFLLGTEFSFDAPGRVQVTPYPYVDLSLRECPEHRPLLRVFARGNGTTQQSLPGRPRLLLTPLRTLRTLSVDLALPGGAVPADPSHVFVRFRAFLARGSAAPPPSYLSNRVLLL